MNATLPNEWQPLTLADVLENLPSGSQVQQGWSPQCEKEPAENGEWGVLKTTAIQPGAFLPEHNKRLPGHLMPRAALEVAEGDLLLTNAGPRSRCAIPCLVRQTRPRLMLSGKFYRFRPKRDLVDPRFLELYLLSPDAQAALDDMKTGISDSGLNLTRGRFLALAVPVPPIDEQRRIVEILEDQLSRLDATSAMLRSCQTRVEAWRRSCIDGLVWRERDVGAVAVEGLLAERMRNGHSARASTTGAGVRALTLTSVTRNSFNDQFTKIVAVEAERVRDLWLRDGDILVQRSNTPELVGTTAIYRGPNDWAIFPDLLIRLRADESRVSPAYLAAAMRTERVHRRLRAQAKGLAGSMPKIDQAAIGSVLVPLPSSAAQDEVVTRVAEIEEGRNRLASEIQVADGRVQSLRRALLAAAFSGQLTR